MRGMSGEELWNDLGAQRRQLMGMGDMGWGLPNPFKAAKTVVKTVAKAAAPVARVAVKVAKPVALTVATGGLYPAVKLAPTVFKAAASAVKTVAKPIVKVASTAVKNSLAAVKTTASVAKGLVGSVVGGGGGGGGGVEVSSGALTADEAASTAMNADGGKILGMPKMAVIIGAGALVVGVGIYLKTRKR